ncbi:actin-binding Rho-activating protein-like [Amphiura filiformis]|uniref:actin-binding Rho-activating protein-like n=1 Tax=Amphiura filiformis TaxID=82378 RepID=UPI003B22341E
MEEEQAVSGKIAMWQKHEQKHKDKQLINPFSEWEGASTRAKLSKDDENYAKPVEGSMTAQRGKAAGERISNEIQELIEIIKVMGKKGDDGLYRINFGLLFNIYLKISNKMVGIMMRARKQGLIDFEGEMLWQRRDDHVMITLLKES